MVPSNLISQAYEALDNLQLELQCGEGLSSQTGWEYTKTHPFWLEHQPTFMSLKWQLVALSTHL